MIKAIIFDCFGVLYPVVSDIYYERHIKEFKYDTSVLNELNRKIDLGLIGKHDFFEGIQNVTGIPAETAAKEFSDTKIVNEEMLKLINSLKKKYQVALLSNAGEDELDCLERDHISGLFNTITVSCKLGIVKPDKRIFMQCVEDLKRKPKECLFIDDGLQNVDGAKKSGIDSIHYKNIKQLKIDLEHVLGKNWGEL